MCRDYNKKKNDAFNAMVAQKMCVEKSGYSKGVGGRNRFWRGKLHRMRNSPLEGSLK